MTPRYALYFAPEPGKALDRFGARWFDAAERWAPLEPAYRARITEAPRRYGFHATLKAPFRLAEKDCLDDLRDSLAAFASGRARPSAPPLALRRLGGFLALMPRAPAPEVSALAQACVETFDRFRAEATPEELARRRAAGLTTRQDGYLLRWGYPYVAEEFRFHMTLTERLDAQALAAVEAALESAVVQLEAEPLVIDAVTLFRQAGTAEPFEPLARFVLGG
ncbi:MAG: DUF1045 domain-containing protein [Kiloniellales bacterium]|nr:DUF1045 domain-containing protein [Kiloniellales bacterium]